MEKTDQLKQILSAVLQASGVSEAEIVGRIKSLKIYTARGVYFLMARQAGFHPFDIAALVGRSRASCILTIKQYMWYQQCGDLVVVELMAKTQKILNKKNE